MLFRRISAHVKRQDWFAVGLDLLIVVGCATPIRRIHRCYRLCCPDPACRNIIALIEDVSVRMAIGQFERSFATVEFSALQTLQFMSAAAPEFMAWSYMEPKIEGEHHSVTETEDDSYGYVHRYDSERILKNADAANITSWVSGWGSYHGSVMAQHHADTIKFRDLLRERLQQ